MPKLRPLPRWVFRAVRFVAIATASFIAVLLLTSPSHAKDLGVEGAIYEPIEEDIRVTFLRRIAREDPSRFGREMLDSVNNYTKNLPSMYLPRADRTVTRWKDAGALVAEDVFMPSIPDWKKGSALELEPVLLAAKGTYFNPVAHMPAQAIPRIFLFDATDYEQLQLAIELAALKLENFALIAIAGDVGELSELLDGPVFHAGDMLIPQMQVRAAPTLLGFGQGWHQGHIAITEFKLPASAQDVKAAWFGLSEDEPEQKKTVAAPPATKSKR